MAIRSNWSMVFKPLYLYSFLFTCSADYRMLNSPAIIMDLSPSLFSSIIFFPELFENTCLGFLYVLMNWALGFMKKFFF